MKIELKTITIRDLVKGYCNDGDNGIRGYSGKLDIRPPYQREFVYDDNKRQAVIESIKQGFPLNVMYWSVKNDGTYEILDGQQRTISICQFYNKEFSVPYGEHRYYFRNLSDDRRNQFLDYELMIYLCSGKESEKMNWFKTINIAGEKLSDQEMRSAIYSSKWVTDARRYFVKNSLDYFKYLKGNLKRQDFLETVLKWISGDKIEDYMGRNQHKDNAKELWDYFEGVIEWVESVFIKYRREMKGVEWGYLYQENKRRTCCAEQMEDKVKKLMSDEDVTKKSGIYKYVFDGQKKHLSIRTFSDRDKRTIYSRQDGVCIHCKEKFGIDEMDADHIIPWSKDGRTELSNCQVLCRECNRRKGPD